MRTGRKQSAEERAKRSANMKARWADPEFRARNLPKLLATSRSDKAREASRRTAIALNERKRIDGELEANWRVGIYRANRSKAKRRALKAKMKIIANRPQNIEHMRAVGKKTAHKGLNAKQHRRYRGGEVPAELEPLWKTIRPKVGAQEAMRIIKAEMARAQ